MELIYESMYSHGRDKVATFLHRLLHNFWVLHQTILTVVFCCVGILYCATKYMPELFKIEVSLENKFRLIL